MRRYKGGLDLPIGNIKDVWNQDDQDVWYQDEYQDGCPFERTRQLRVVRTRRLRVALAVEGCPLRRNLDRDDVYMVFAPMTFM